MSNQDDLAARTLTLVRNIDAPLALVWQAWTEAQHIAQWWGPKGMQTQVVSHEFRQGGDWVYAMTMPDGNQFLADGVYIEIITEQLIRTTANFKPMTEGVELIAKFEAQGAATKFTFSVVHETQEYCKQQEDMGFMNGWGSTFDRLVEYVTKDKA